LAALFFYRAKETANNAGPLSTQSLLIGSSWCTRD
jgi:hypothetical protein